MRFLIQIIFLSFLLSACRPQQLFMESAIPYTGPEVIQVDEYEHVLQSDDKVIVSVWGHDELGVGSTFSVYSSTLEQGKYISINQQGNISLPLIGTVELAGLTLREANLYLKQLFSRYVKSPIVYIRVLSLQVSVIGEVNVPGNYELDKERTSLLSVLASAQGMTKFADKENIRIMRTHDDGELEEININLTDRTTLFRTDLSLRSRDVVYVPERPGKYFEESLSGKIVPLVGILGSVAITLSLLNRRE
ncbi:MAG: polysaccharide biosynthesis/export family protein [Bacteroidota bacterium]